MSTVLIIGAGAARAEACAKQCTKRDLPPLDTDFFALTQRHKVAQNLAVLRRYVDQQYRIDVTKRPYPRMEEIFGLVYTDTRMTPPPDGARDAFGALCRLYHRTILETTNLIEPSSRGPLVRLIRHVFDKGACSIITFNQDLLIEKALSAASVAGIRWSPKSGYVIDFSQYTSPSDSVAKTHLFPIGDTKPANVRLMKLHGSLNWYTITRSATQIPATMPKSAEVRCTRRRVVPVDMTYTGSDKTNKQGRRQWHTWPVIVPPVYEKGEFVRTLLAPIWESARGVLAQAAEIIVFGYSFPQADQQGRCFFRRATANTTRLRRLTVINPDPMAAIVAQDIFSPDYMVLSPNVASYLRDN